MSRGALLRDERSRLAMVLSLDGEYLDEMLLKVAFLRRIYLSEPAGTVVTLRQIVNILEDEDLGLSDASALAALQASGLLVAGDDGWRTSGEVRPLHPLSEEAARDAPVATREELVALFTDGADTHRTAALDALLRCVDRTTRWGLKIAEAVPEGLDGVPCFWDYDDQGYRAFNLDPASVTTSDALRLIVERIRVGAPLLAVCDDDRASAQRLWQMLLDLRRTDSVWNYGAFSVSGEDDDFVGAFDPARPELGPCPTVDATGGAVVALCAAVRATSLGGNLIATSHEAIRDGVDFLLRCQLASGGWPLYRYENDEFVMVERDVSSWYAVDALSEAVRAGVLDAAASARSYDAALAFVELAERAARTDGEALTWTPDFFAVRASDSEVIQATACVSLALGAVGSAWQEVAERVDALRRAAVRGITQLWSPDADKLAVLNFRVPTWGGPAATKFPWEWPLDALAVQVLSDVDEPWDEDLSAKLATAVGGFLAIEINGHWNDLLMKRESGKDRAIVGSTIFFHTALLAYIARLVATGRSFFEVGPT